MYNWNRIGPWDEFARFILTNFPPTPEPKKERKEMAVSLIGAGKAEVEARIAELEAQLADAEVKLAAFVPEEPAAPFAVVRFQKWSVAYTYAAIKIEGRWYLTQDGSRSARQGIPPKTWADLLNWIGDRNWRSIEVLS